jgi:hypothetical protein
MMRRPAAVVLVGVLALVTGMAGAGAEQKPSTSTTKKPAPKTQEKKPATSPKVESPEVSCPALLGTGITTRVTFCDVLAGSTPEAGILVPIPPHKGPASLSFNLHNRQTYSEQEVKARRAFARYVASIGVFTMDNTLLSRAVIDSEFRTARDLVDRVGGGAGPGGVKAVAPTGTEAIRIDIPADADQVSILGEKLSVIRNDSSELFSAPGRPIAIISDVKVEYTPAPAKKPATTGKKPAAGTTTKKK